MTTTSAASPHLLARYRAEFPIFEHRTYLNTCSLGALSHRSRRRVVEFLDTWEHRGAAAWYDVWWDLLADTREGYARLIGAKPSEIALHASVSTASGVIASALDYTKRPKVVTTSLDFPTVIYQWLAKEARGVEVVIVESPDGIAVPVDAIAHAVDERTALVVTSHVYFATGAIQDIRGVAQVAHAHGALCFIDAYQSVGQIPLAVQETGVDFLCAGGLKWLLGGPGIVFLYVREEHHDTLTPTVTGWFAHDRQFDFDSWSMDFVDDARRYEQGTPALAAVQAQLGGLELIHEIGVPAIRDVVKELTRDLVERVRDAGLRLTIAEDDDQRSAIVMVQDENPKASVARLAAANIVADARPGHVRLSPFFYNLPDDNVAAIRVLGS
jgi:selenocysteine lyase/cysteine desulfurase